MLADFFLLLVPFSLAPLSIYVFWVRVWTGGGDGDAIRESTGRDLRFHLRNPRVSARGGGRPAAPPGPMERPAHCGFAKRGAVPAPLREPRSMEPHNVLTKVKVTSYFSPLSSPSLYAMIRKKFLIHFNTYVRQTSGRKNQGRSKGAGMDA
ncbi:MAG: hypothetical protein H6Q42_4128 [Deltaproteobacteria bacterium]|nr:hypothetical protein [Deltaproteobacteria bacterium]